MTHNNSVGPVPSDFGDTLQQQQQQLLQHEDGSPRRHRLLELILAGFEHLLSSLQEGQTGGIDGRGAGYVVWVPRKEQYEHQKQQQQRRRQQQELWEQDDEEQEEEEDDDDDDGDGGKPLVLYGGGFTGLFNVR